MGLFSAGTSRTLMDGEWRHSTWAEYAKFPLENLYPLDEDLLLKKQGYSIRDLCTLPTLLVPYGGLDEIDLKVGETIVIAPVSQALSHLTFLLDMVSWITASITFIHMGVAAFYYIHKESG